MASGVRYSIVSRRAPAAVLRSMALLGTLIFGAPLVLVVIAWLAGSTGKLFEFMLCSNPATVLYVPGAFLNRDVGAEEELFVFTLVWVLVYACVALVRFARLPAAYRAAVRKEA